MRYFSSVVAGPIFITLLICQGCSPTLNWRDVRAEPSPLLALFPCKPERHTRTVALAAHSVTMTMLSCDADGATLTLAYADLKDASLVPAALAHWQAATLGNVQAGPVVKQSFSFKGVSALPPPVQLFTQGVRQDGVALALQAAWFSVDALVFQATVQSQTGPHPAAEPYFAGFRLP